MVLICLLAPSMLWAADVFDFRNATWGMTKEQVKASENLPLDEENTYDLIYIMPPERNADEVQLWYEFDAVDIELKHAFISYEYKEPLTERIYAEYLKLKTELTAKYGLPYSEKEVFDERHTPQAFDENDKAAGVKGGYLILNTEWRQARSKIELLSVPYGMPSEPSIFVMVYYHSDI